MNARTTLAAAVVVLALSPAPSRAQEALSLEEAALLALENQPRLAQARAAVDEAAAEADLARAPLLPRVVYEESITRGNQPVFAFGTRLAQGRFTEADFAPDRLNDPSAVNDFASRLAVEVPLLHAAGWTAVRAAGAAEEAAEAQRELAEHEVLVMAVDAYLGRQVALAAAEAAEEMAAAAREDARRTRALESAGMARQVDALALEVAAQQAEAQALAARGHAQEAAVALAHALGIPSADGIVLTTPLESGVAQPASAGETDLEQHPAHRAAAAGQRAARRAERAARLGYVPTLAAFGDLQSHRPGLVDSGGTSYTVGVVLCVELFRGLERFAASRRAAARRRGADAQADAVDSALRLELERARIGLETASARVEVTARGVALSAEAVRLEEARLEGGVSEPASLLRSRSALFGARLQHLVALRERRLSEVRLAAARGSLDSSQLTGAEGAPDSQRQQAE